jgi:hypothetical protein
VFFEFAVVGIPTILFIPNVFGNISGRIQYPSENLEIDDILIFLVTTIKYFDYCLKVEKWALKYYEAFLMNRL